MVVVVVLVIVIVVVVPAFVPVLEFMFMLLPTRVPLSSH